MNENIQRSYSGCAFVALALAAAGCAADADPGGQSQPVGEPTASAQQALSGMAIYQWNCNEECTLDIDLDPHTWTCVLAGVSGNLQGGVDPDPGTSEVKVWPYVGSRNAYFLTIVPYVTGQPLGATVACLPASANRIYPAAWSDGQDAISILGGNSNRQCFLTGVTNYNGFSTRNDFVQVSKDDFGTWYLGGDAGSTTVATTATAVCVDVPQDANSVTRLFPKTVANGDTSTTNLLFDPATDNSVCGLTKLGGHFRTDDFADEIRIFYDPGTRYLRWTLQNGKTGEATCVR